jgi:hypothetical protein
VIKIDAQPLTLTHDGLSQRRDVDHEAVAHIRGQYLHRTELAPLDGGPDEDAVAEGLPLPQWERLAQARVQFGFDRVDLQCAVARGQGPDRADVVDCAEVAETERDQIAAC